MRELHQKAAQLDVKVEYVPLPLSEQGFYLHRRKLIVINSRLSPLWERCTLAHELGHAFYGHTDSSVDSERQADEYAARLLISPLDYYLAARVTDSPFIIADDLGVNLDILRAYTRLVHVRQHSFRYRPVTSNSPGKYFC